MRVCHVIASINQNTGGPAFSASELTQGLAKNGIDVSLFTLDYSHLGKQTLMDGVDVCSFPVNFLTKNLRGLQCALRQSLLKSGKGFDLIHNHGLWMFPNWYARQAAVKNRLPLIISPRGMLEPWSLKRSQIKKKIVWILWENENLKKAALFHATSQEEAHSIRQLGFKQPIAVIPNSIPTPGGETVCGREILEKDFPCLKGKKWLLFMSRIHPKKGLQELLQSWKVLERQFSGWHLIIAGPDLTGYGKDLDAYVKQNSLQDRVTFTGMLTDQFRESALSGASVFVLPTHSENFGRVIGESLSYGVPVITTKEAPWQDLIQFKCGWWVLDNQQDFQDALSKALNTPENELKLMGERGRCLIQEKYSAQSCAMQMVGVYRWVINGGQTPSCVKV